MTAREIPLTQGKIALVDDEDYDRVATFKWCAVAQRAQSGHVHWYAKRGIRQDGKTITCYLHRFILGVPDAIRIDHENGDGLNCTRGNMRYASPRQNAWNSRPGRNNTSGFKGVQQIGTRFRALIKVVGKPRHLGTFGSALEAARVYDAAARHFWGSYAWTNFPEVDSEAAVYLSRWLAGERQINGHPLRVLKDENVQEARRRYAAGGVLLRELAAEFGVKTAAMTHAVSGRTFKHVTDPPPISKDKRSNRHDRVLERAA